jgi:hypothetical protein
VAENEDDKSKEERGAPASIDLAESADRQRKYQNPKRNPELIVGNLEVSSDPPGPGPNFRVARHSGATDDFLRAEGGEDADQEWRGFPGHNSSTNDCRNPRTMAANLNLGPGHAFHFLVGCGH